MIVVSDASPLIILAKIGKLDLLRSLYRGVIIPEEVKVLNADLILLDERAATPRSRS